MWGVCGYGTRCRAPTGGSADCGYRGHKWASMGPVRVIELPEGVKPDSMPEDMVSALRYPSALAISFLVDLPRPARCMPPYPDLSCVPKDHGHVVQTETAK